MTAKAVEQNTPQHLAFDGDSLRYVTDAERPVLTLSDTVHADATEYARVFNAGSAHRRTFLVRYVNMEESGSPTARIFGDRMRKRRKELNLTISDLFQRTEITVSYISAIERGRANPSLDIMVKIADTLGLSLVDMLRPGDSS